jgi:hypothetical protein
MEAPLEMFLREECAFNFLFENNYTLIFRILSNNQDKYRSIVLVLHLRAYESWHLPQRKTQIMFQNK